MKNAKIHSLPVLLMLALLSACTGDKPAEAPKEQKAAAKPAEETQTETGRTAFHHMYARARLWANDARPVKLESVASTDAAAKEGKASIWRGQFASPGRRGLRPYTWSGQGEERGVSQGTEDTFNPSNTSTQPFDMQFLKTDTDKAFEVAQQKGGEKLLKQSPDTPVLYQLDWDPRKNALLWHVIYGNSPTDAKLHVIVDASTGNYVRTAK